jgi:hypothetical protein
MVFGFCDGCSSPRSHMAYFRAVQACWSRHSPKSASVLFDRKTALIEVHPTCLPQTTGPELPVADKLAQLRASLSQIQPTSQKRRD